MYFVDRKKIEQMLVCLERATSTFQEKKIYETEFEFYALERIAHLIIDCVLINFIDTSKNIITDIMYMVCNYND